MLSIFSALNPLLAHTHTEHTSLVLGFSMYIRTFEMHKQPMLPPVTTHMISERKMEMEGLGHPSAAVKENTRPNRPRADTQHHISEQRKPQTLRLALMRHGSGLQLHLIWELLLAESIQLLFEKEGNKSGNLHYCMLTRCPW